MQHKGIEIWARPITPIYQNYYSYAVAFLNRRTDGTPSDVSVTLKELGLQFPGGYRVEVRNRPVITGYCLPSERKKKQRKVNLLLVKKICERKKIKTCFGFFSFLFFWHTYLINTFIIGLVRGRWLRCAHSTNENKSESKSFGNCYPAMWSSIRGYLCHKSLYTIFAVRASIQS